MENICGLSPGMNDTARAKVKTKDNIDGIAKHLNNSVKFIGDADRWDTSMEMMKEFFELCKTTDNEIVKRTICKIDAVAFLVKATTSRATQEQVTIFI